jgi:hypothetical protein
VTRLFMFGAEVAQYLLRLFDGLQSCESLEAILVDLSLDRAITPDAESQRAPDLMTPRPHPSGRLPDGLDSEPL